MGIGGGGSRSARSFEFSNNLNKPNRSFGEIRRKAGVQVQNRYSGRHGPRSTEPSENDITQDVRGAGAFWARLSAINGLNHQEQSTESIRTGSCAYTLPSLSAAEPAV